jgi:transposase InsO family protein
MYPIRVSHFGKVKPLKRAKKLRKPKGFIADQPGHLVELDSIERLVFGVRRYIITFVDVFSKFTFAYAYLGHSSRTAADFFSKVKQIFPFEIKHLQTDNGSEFAKEFALMINQTSSTHFHTYPKTPQANGHIERYNRTIQEEYVDYHASELNNLELFNSNLMDYLIWYNTERPHWSLNLKSPIQFLLSQDIHLSKSGWPDTNP